MFRFAGELLKGRIGDLTDDQRVRFSWTSLANGSDLGGKYFPISVIKGHYNGTRSATSDGVTYNIGDTVLLEDRGNALYDDEDLYLGRILDLTDDGRVRISFIYKNDNYFPIEWIRPYLPESQVIVRGDTYRVGDKVIVRACSNDVLTKIISVTRDGYIRVDHYCLNDGYIRASKAELAD